MAGMGSGWFDAMGSGWFDAMGSGWMDAGGGGGGGRGFVMRADRPLAEHPVPSNFAAEFPPRYWDGDLLALTFLPDFFAFKNAKGETWQQAITVKPPPQVTDEGTEGTGDSIKELLVLAVTERPEAMGEILNQHQNQQLCFLQLLMINHNSHPRTYYLMKLAARVGEVVMMRLKRQYNRARPSQICPTLYPPVSVPGHASYPAGHALIAHLTARCLAEATEKRAQGTPTGSPFADVLNELARNIGRNRVIAGLHFRSDIDAGADAAEKTHLFLQQIQTYKDAVAAAQDEWPRWP